MVVRRNHQVASLTADGARSEVVLRGALVVGGTPRTDALEAENMVALVQHAELAPRTQHILQTNLALLVISLIEGAWHRGLLVL